MFDPPESPISPPEPPSSDDVAVAVREIQLALSDHIYSPERTAAIVRVVTFMQQVGPYMDILKAFADRGEMPNLAVLGGMIQSGSEPTHK